MFTAMVVFYSGKAHWFANPDSDHERIYIHQRDAARKRFLKVDDRIKYELVPSATKPGAMRSVNVEVIAHVIVRQLGAPVAGGVK
jgi:hypothetical protein